MNRLCALLLIVGLASCSDTGGRPTDDRVKDMVSRAAGIPIGAFREIVAQGSLQTFVDHPDAVCSCPISLTFFLVEDLTQAGLDPRDLSAPAPVRPDEIAGFFGGPGDLEDTEYASAIRPEYITEFSVSFEGDSATGWVAFQAEQAYRGRVGYRLARMNGQWAVTEFILPHTEVILRWKDQEGWVGEAIPGSEPPESRRPVGSE